MTAPLIVRYLDRQKTEQALAGDRLLALIGFGETRLTSAEPRLVRVPLRNLGGVDPIFEAWFGCAPVSTSRHGAVRLAEDGALLFGDLVVDEAAAGGIEAATVAAYDQIFACLAERGYPHLLRVWHFLPDINAPCADLDRYQAFCRGRFTALSRVLETFEVSLPAASALGSHRPGLALQFLAARRPGLQIENPRQVSAFRYPVDYGPRSPSFSRSMLLPQQGERRTLLISGTASIVGHRSRHANDVAAQLCEMFSNLDALLVEAATTVGQPMAMVALRAYLRLPDCAGLVCRMIADRLGSTVPLSVLEADICRADLLVEVEGLACSGA